MDFFPFTKGDSIDVFLSEILERTMLITCDEPVKLDMVNCGLFRPEPITSLCYRLTLSIA